MIKRKATSSGVEGVEIVNALHTLTQLKGVVLREQRLKAEAETRGSEEIEDSEVDEDEGGPPTEVVLEKLGDLISVLKTKVEGPLSLSFPDATFEILRERLNIIPHNDLVERGDHMARALESAAQGGDKYMSSKDMYRHLNLLQNLVPRTANVRLWIDATFLRASAMLSGENRMVLNLEHNVPAVGIPVEGGTRLLKLFGTIDYTALAVPQSKHRSLLQSSAFEFVRQKAPNGLFVTEVKLDGKQLADHVPRAVAGMYGAATFLGKKTIRGALSNGYDWLFIILSRNEGGNGGSYRLSPVLEVSHTEGYPKEVRAIWPNIIAGILSYWVEHGFDDLDDNDWFV